MNTRVKHFTMRNTCTPYHEVQVCARLTTKLTRVCQKWGQQVNKDPRSIVLMHQDVRLNRRLNIGDVGIKNKDFVYAFPEN